MTYDFDISHSMSVAVPQGPSMSKAGTVSVGAFDTFRATAVKNGGLAELDLVAELAATITFVSMKADNYESLTFKVGELGDVITFDGPIMLVGAGQVALLGAALDTILFTNADTEADANIDVCIGRSGEVPAE